MPLFVSSEAYLGHPGWLSEGYRLWKLHAPFPRDFFLVVPTPDLDKVTAHEVKYADAVRCTRGALIRLRRPVWVPEVGWNSTDIPLVAEPLHGFWTEHSERSDLPSWGSAFEYEKSWLDDLGNWGADGSENYIRTRRLRVETIQRNVCELLRCSFGEADILDEDDLAVEAIRYLGRKGIAIEVARTMLGPLLYFGPGAVAQDRELVEHPVRVDLANVDIEEELEAEPVEDPPAPPPASASERRTRAVALQQPLPSDATGFVVNERARGGPRLHRIGGCPWEAGLDFKVFRHFPELPPSSAYVQVCKRCWRQGEALDESTDEESSSSSASSSSDAD